MQNYCLATAHRPSEALCNVREGGLGDVSWIKGNAEQTVYGKSVVCCGRSVSSRQRTRAGEQGERSWVRGLSLHPQLTLPSVPSLRTRSVGPVGSASNRAWGARADVPRGRSLSLSDPALQFFSTLFLCLWPWVFQVIPLRGLIVLSRWPDLLSTWSGPHHRDDFLDATFYISIWTAQSMNFSNVCCWFCGQRTVFSYLIPPKRDINKLLKEFV